MEGRERRRVRLWVVRRCLDQDLPLPETWMPPPLSEADRAQLRDEAAAASARRLQRQARQRERRRQAAG